MEREIVIDRHLMDQMESILSRLHATVTVLDQDPAAQMCNDLPLNTMAEGQPKEVGERLCMMLRRPAAVLCCDKDQPGAEDLLQLAGALISNMAVGGSRTETSFDVYRRTLLGELTGAELDALSHEYQLPRDLERCVMVFHMVQTDRERAYDLLEEITPLEDRDVLIDMDRHTVALIKDVEEVISSDELIQYGQALQETLMSETAHQITVGIGRTCHTVEELRESYSEARKAIEVGRQFQPEASIFAYSRLILERFLMEMPPDVNAAYHSMLFNRRNQRLFNEEMLYTIDMFFKKDLNLSDTARQLYIHRNTLVYRLDKVQRQTGLDLRSFEDAVTFKILMELKNCCGKK